MIRGLAVFYHIFIDHSFTTFSSPPLFFDSLFSAFLLPRTAAFQITPKSGLT